MDIVLQQAANGLVLGMSYALVATGLTLVFGVLRMMNLSHGELYMLGAYILSALMQYLGLPYVVGCVLSVLLVALIGYFFGMTVVQPASHLEPINAMLATFGVSTLLSNLVLLIFKATPRMVSSPFQVVFQIGPVFLTIQKLIVVGMGLLLNLGVYLVIHHTTFGKMIWAISEQRTAAEIVGIDTKRMHNLAFTMGAVLAAISGVLVSALYSLAPNMGSGIMTKCFAIVVLGGLGSIPGAIIGGLLLGLAESLFTIIIPSQWTPAIAFVLLIVLLILKPEGLIGKSKGVKL